MDSDQENQRPSTASQRNWGDMNRIKPALGPFCCIKKKIDRNSKVSKKQLCVYMSSWLQNMLRSQYIKAF